MPESESAVAAYRDFLIRTDGAADPLRFQLARREAFFARIAREKPRASHAPDRDAFRRMMFSRRAEPGADRRLLWLVATAKLNQSERFGVGLGEVYGKDQDKFDAEPERLYVMLQEHYHSRLLADVVSMFDLPFPTVPPPRALRWTIQLFVWLPHEWTLPLVGASEIVGCHLFRAMRDEGLRLFADDPPVAERIRALYDEILADEIGHVGFIAAKLSPRARRATRWLARRVAWRSIVGAVPELEVLFGRERVRALVERELDVAGEAAAFGERAYAAALM